MIKLDFPGITQAQFADAFAVLEECKVPHLPTLGFAYPFMGPGGQYGHCWWERDTALALSGYKWLDQDFCERCLENFSLVQKENGRIPLYGYDKVLDYDEELSAIPLLFEVAYRVCRRTTDNDYIARIYRMLCRYMEWWLSPVKRDAGTGLVCGIFEETDPCDFHDQHTAAEVDLNVQLCVGADVLSRMADRLGLTDEAAAPRRTFDDLRARVNRYLYDPETGLYHTWLVKEGRRMTERVYNSAFDVFKRRIVTADRVPRLLAALKDDSLFGWNSRWGLTTMAKNSPEYVETVGVYQGHPSWKGNIWTQRNEIITTGLAESGLDAEAAHLALQTVRTFNGNYAEFVSPSTGMGHGVERYGWSASQYVELLIEVIFGVDYDAWNDRLTVTPHIDPALYGETVSIRNLSLGHGRYAHIRIECGETSSVSCRVTDCEEN